MRNSAACYAVGTIWLRHTGQLLGCYAESDPALLDRWLRQERSVFSSTAAPSATIQEAAVDFMRQLDLFHHMLMRDQQPHLLLVQPHLSLRDPRILGRTEKALYNYYHGGKWKGSIPPGPDPFMAELHRRVQQQFSNSEHVVSMANFHGSTNSIFIDTCHFTAAANDMIARELAKTILQRGRYTPFQATP